MPEKSDTTEKEYLVVGLPDSVEPGTNLRLLAVAPSESAAEETVRALGAGTIGRVAILERKAVFARRPAIESVEVNEPIMT